MKKASPAKVFFASALTTAAGCSPVTFRSWRNRNGLFQQPHDQGGWNRFSSADIIAAAIVTDLTSRGMNAQHAVDIAMKTLPILENEGHEQMLLVSFHENAPKIEVSGFRRSELISGLASVYLLIDLDTIRSQILKRLELRAIHVANENGAIIDKVSFVVEQLPGHAANESGNKAREKKKRGGSSRRTPPADGPRSRSRAGG